MARRSPSLPVCDFRELSFTARRAGIPFQSFRKVAEPQVATFLRERRPDLLWVIGLSQLVPRSLIEIAPGGGVGFHPTMLPRGRGRAPVAWTILLGELAAVSLFYLTDEADAGDLIAQREVPVLPDDYSEDLIARTNGVLKEMVRDLAPAIQRGTLPRRPQDHSRATHYAKRTPEDGRIDWSQSTEAIYRLVRAAGRPYFGAFTEVNGSRWVLWRASPVAAELSVGPGARTAELSSRERSAPPGEVLRVEGSGVWIRTGDGALCATEWTGRPPFIGNRMGG